MPGDVGGRHLSRRTLLSAAAFAGVPPPRSGNDVTLRGQIWRRFDGDDWAAFDALPPSVRRRLHEHAYDAWTVNALMLWRIFRRQLASSARAERRLLRYLDECEEIERETFAKAYRAALGVCLPHVAAGATVQRYARSPGSYAGPSSRQHRP